MLRAAAAFVAAAAVTVGLAAPAHAYSSISVHNPNGDEYESGTEVFVDGYNGSDYTETFYVECDDAYVTTRVDVAPGYFSESIGSYVGPDTCRIYDYYSGDRLATFKVAPPATTVSDASVSADVFYPLVRDRYQDTVTFRWRQNHDGRATVRVVNADGRTVRTASPWGRQGRNEWTWDGKKDNGALVAKGRYRFKVTVNANTVSAPVAVKTAVVTKRFTKRKEGNQAASFATGGNCFARRDSYYQVAELDCWGGRFAKANYRIPVPVGAFDVRGTIDLLRAGSDLCCQGQITKGWSRPSKRSVAFWAKVTGWRATEVNYVKVVYKQRVRI
jgi:hypothetical protein